MTRQHPSSDESESGRPSNVSFAGSLGTIAFGEKSLVGATNNPSKNPAVVDSDLGFPSHGELHQNYDAIRRETLEIALSGRLPANHEIMEQQRTLYEFDRKAWGTLPLWGYGYNYPANQDLIPTL